MYTNYVILHILGYVSPVTFPRYSFMDRHQVAEDANAQNYENGWFQPHNLNMKILPSCAVTFLDLSTESNVNDTIPPYPHLTSNLQQTKNETTNVVINIIVASSWWWP